MFNPVKEKSISLKCTNKDSQFPIELLNIWDMTQLEIIGGSFTYFPEDIKILKNLKKISLISTKVEKIPKEVFLLPELCYLNLKNNSLQELPALENVSKIKELILGRNHFKTQSLESFLNYTPNLHYLDIGHNFIEKIPESLFSLSKLRRLNLEKNKLDDVPLKLMELKNLIHLSL